MSMAGSALMKNICKYIQNVYKHEPKRPTIINSIQSKVKKIEPSIKNTISSNPEEANLHKLRKDWDDLMLKYQKEVEKKGKSFKGTKAKTKGSSKSSKSSAKIGKTNGIDYVQTLPIWTVKKILNYLDKKTLKRIKGVNSYWSYAVDSLQKDLKARKSLNSFIKSIEKNSGTSLPVYEKHPMIKPKAICKKRFTKSDRLKMEGTCCKAIRKEIIVENETYEQSLLAKTTKSLAADHLIPMNMLKAFPRKSPNPEEKYLLHQSPPCIKHEGGVKIKNRPSQYEPEGFIELQQKMEIVSPQPSVSLGSVEETEQETEERNPISSFYFVPQL